MKFPSLLKLALAVYLPAVAGTSFAQTEPWPARALTMIVPYAAGGNVDLMARWVAPELARRLGQPIVIENIAGAGGVIGTDKAVHAKPNGYTLLLTVESTIVIAPKVMPNTVRYDGLKDLEPVTLLGGQPLVLVGKPALGAHDARALYEEIRASPGKYSYATSGVGTSLHLGGEMLMQQGQVSMVHIPYRAGTQIVNDLAGNQIDLAVVPVSMVMQQVQAGKIKVYGVFGNPSPALPGVPSLSTVPVWKDVELLVWQGIFVPKGTDPAIVARINAELLDVLKSPDLMRKFESAGISKMALNPKEFAAFLKTEDAKFSAVVSKGKITAE